MARRQATGRWAHRNVHRVVCRVVCRAVCPSNLNIVPRNGHERFTIGVVVSGNRWSTMTTTTRRAVERSSSSSSPTLVVSWHRLASSARPPACSIAHSSGSRPPVFVVIGRRCCWAAAAAAILEVWRMRTYSVRRPSFCALSDAVAAIVPSLDDVDGARKAAAGTATRSPVASLSCRLPDARATVDERRF